MTKNKATQREIIGLFPAGGHATRIAPLPGSKELYPIGFRPVDEGRSLRPKVVCHYLLEKMRLAGVRKVYIVLREGKWDIPAYLGDGDMLDMHLAYLMMRRPFGAPYTLDQAYPFVQDALIALGFPDVLFQPDDAFIHLLARQAASQADVVLGLFPTAKPRLSDMVGFDEQGQVHQIVIKPAQTDLTYTWMIAIWTPAFTQFMHDYLADLLSWQTSEVLNSSELFQKKELFVGDVIQAAIEQGMPVQAVPFPEGKCLDIGLPDNLIQAVRDFLPPSP